MSFILPVFTFSIARKFRGCSEKSNFPFVIPPTILLHFISILLIYLLLYFNLNNLLQSFLHPLTLLILYLMSSYNMLPLHYLLLCYHNSLFLLGGLGMYKRHICNLPLIFAKLMLC